MSILENKIKEEFGQYKKYYLDLRDVMENDKPTIERAVAQYDTFQKLKKVTIENFDILISDFSEVINGIFGEDVAKVILNEVANDSVEYEASKLKETRDGIPKTENLGKI